MVALEPGPQPDAKYEARFVATATQRGHSQWFLQQTVKDHAATQYHPFMEAIFRSTLDADLYCRYLKEQLAIFRALDFLAPTLADTPFAEP